MVLVIAGVGVLVAAMLASTRPTVSSADQVLGHVAHGHSPRASARVNHPPTAASPAAAAASGRVCQPSARPAGYVNPLARANVAPRRVDQGVDYAGSGTLVALGAARITTVATTDTGWPGVFIEYQLLGGPEAGCHVYYAEAIVPIVGIHVGQTVQAGQPIATITPNSSTGIEIGWGAGHGHESYAAQAGQWSATHEASDIPSAAGLTFSSLIGALGGPEGIVEG
jgi:hypothetical protein